MSFIGDKNVIIHAIENTLNEMRKSTKRLSCQLRFIHLFIWILTQFQENTTSP